MRERKTISRILWILYNTVGTIQVDRLGNLDYQGPIFILVHVRANCHITKVRHISLIVPIHRRARVKLCQDCLCREKNTCPQ